MRLILLFTLLYASLFALEITISKGADKEEHYSVLNLANSDAFLCEPKKDQFGVIKKVLCTFKKIPQNQLKPLQTQFFTIKTKIYKKNFFLIISTPYQLYIRPIIFDLTQDSTIFTPKTQIAKKWVIVSFSKKLPYIQEQSQNEMALNMPFVMEDEMLPYVGGLDLKGNPVHIQESEDVKAFVEVKNLFKDKKYDDCIERVNEVLQYYPKTLFASELLYYKIKSFYRLKNYEAVLELSKEYLHNFSSDENVPEILMMVAVSYYKIGLFSDAEYFFDRLFTEHADSIYAKWGYIYKGDMAFDGGETKKAQKFYRIALTQTKNLEIAATAAFKLAKLYVADGKFQKAKEYINKILKAKPDFFYEHYNQAKEMMFDLSENKEYLEAAKIDEAILQKLPKRHDDYESNLRYLGIWYAKAGEKKRAIAALDRYLKEFQDGDFVEEVQKARDNLFFDQNKKLSTKELLKRYDALIQEYGNDVIGQKALYEKAKLMLKQKMYSDILQIKDQIKALDSELFSDKDEIIQKAILGLMQNALENKQCQVVLDISHENNVTLSSRWDDGLFECFMKAANYQKAKAIASKYLRSNDLELKKKWLYRYAKIDFATGNYTEAISVAKDLLALIDNIQKSPYKDIYRVLFDSYERVGNFDGMIQSIAKIEQLFGLDYKDIDRYVDMINVGVAKKDDTIIIKYGKKLYDLQQRLNSHAQSPFVEFALYQAYMNKEEYKKALEVISSLDSVALQPEQRARQKYLKGAVLEKLWRDSEAKKAYKEAIKADPNSSWANLAKSALELE